VITHSLNQLNTANPYKDIKTHCKRLKPKLRASLNKKGLTNG